MQNTKSRLLALALCAVCFGGYTAQLAQADDGALAVAALDTASADAAKPATKQAPSDGFLKVARFELAAFVQEREPVGISTTFESGQKVYAFLELKNKGGPETAVFVRFEREGSKSSGQGIRLAVPSKGRHRTFAFTASTKHAGTYRCVVTSQDGTVLVEKTYEVTKR